MSRKFIVDFKENEHIEGVFYVSEKTMGVGKTGKNYLSVKLSDKSGIIDGKIWDKVDNFNSLIDRDEFVYIRGVVQLYQGTQQIVINDLRKPNEQEIILDDFVPESNKNIDMLWKEFLDLGASLKDIYIKTLFNKIFCEDKDIQERFKTYPAAKSLHHAYKGGLLEHSLNVAKLASFICDFYENNLNRDVLIFSAAFHDFGKIYELSFSYTTTYTNEGRLLGHIILADEVLITKAATIPNFPHKTLNLLRHILISHHGEYEFGSPKRPKTAEAFAIHFIDNLDAKLNGFFTVIEKDVQDGEWTGIIKAFDRQLYKAKIEEHVEQTQKKESNLNSNKFNPVLKNLNFDLFKDKDRG